MGMSKSLLKDSYVKSELNLKEFLDNQAAKNYAYYKRDHSDILMFLEKHLRSIISDERVLQLMPKVYVNDVHRVVKRLSLIYNNEPKRTFSKDKIDEKVLDVLNDAFTQYKEFHRLAKLLNTILVRPIWSEKKQKFVFLTLGRHYATAITSEEHKHDLEEIWYLKEVEIKGKKEFVRVHWTDTDYWITDQNDNKIQIEGLSAEGDINPYGRIPFVELRLEDSTDYWGDGMSDFVNLIEANNAKLCDALYKQWLSFGYPIGTNLSVTAEEFQIAPYKPMMVDNARNDMISPSLAFVSPDHQIEQDKELIDYMRRAGGTSQGLSASNFSNEILQQSGYAKTIDNQELLDQNKEDRPILRKFEFELFDMMKLE